jgi:hypothetical protein
VIGVSLVLYLIDSTLILQEASSYSRGGAAGYSDLELVNQAATIMAGDRGRGGGGRGSSSRGRGTPGRGTPQQGRGSHAAFNSGPDYNTPNSSGRGRGRGRAGNSGSSSSPWFGGDRGTPASAGRGGGGRGGGSRFTPQQHQQYHSPAAAALSSVSGTAAVAAGDRELLLISRDAKMHHVWEVRMECCCHAVACGSDSHACCITSIDIRYKCRQTY